MSHARRGSPVNVRTPYRGQCAYAGGRQCRRWDRSQLCGSHGVARIDGRAVALIKAADRNVDYGRRIRWCHPVVHERRQTEPEIVRPQGESCGIHKVGQFFREHCISQTGLQPRSSGKTAICGRRPAVIIGQIKEEGPDIVPDLHRRRCPATGGDHWSRPVMAVWPGRSAICLYSTKSSIAATPFSLPRPESLNPPSSVLS